ncbi:MAG: MbnP family copper-binding protein [Deinococcota bacterium]
MKSLSLIMGVALTAILNLAHAQMDDVTLTFDARVNDELASCGVTYEGVGTTGASIEFTDLRFYVSNLGMLTADGDMVMLELTQDGIWQTDNVALLDFEDASGLCNGNSAMNATVTASVAAGDYTALVFDLGVPEDLNHIDAATAPSPLNVTPMWWNWRGGYKFARIDMVGAGAGDDAPAWFLHLGSTGCMADEAVMPPAEACMRPNRVTVQLDDFNPAENIIVADIGSLLSASDVGQSLELAPPGCMSGPADPDCNALFLQGFDLSQETGLCEGGVCSGQLLFKAE